MNNDAARFFNRVNNEFSLWRLAGLLISLLATDL